jgi:hypothetical protein
MHEIQWQVQHPHPDNVDEFTVCWFEDASLKSAQRYANAGFLCRSREVTEWKEANPNA